MLSCFLPADYMWVPPSIRNSVPVIKPPSFEASIAMAPATYSPAAKPLTDDEVLEMLRILRKLNPQGEQTG